MNRNASIWLLYPPIGNQDYYVEILTIAGGAVTCQGVARPAGAGEGICGVCAHLRAATIVSVAFIHSSDYKTHRKAYQSPPIKHIV